jgi:hypothetical protein
MKAFPLSNMAGLNQQGMELRDYFAAKCMPIVHKMIEHNHNNNLDGDFEWNYDEEDFESMAGMAYGMADAMMKARGQE